MIPTYLVWVHMKTQSLDFEFLSLKKNVFECYSVYLYHIGFPKKFNVENDFTEEELEQVKKENEWAEEKQQ